MTRAARESAAVIEQFFQSNGQILLPIVNLIESASQVVETVLHEIQVHSLEAILVLSAEQLAGARTPGKASGDIRHHGSQAGRVQLADRKVKLKRPRLDATPSAVKGKTATQAPAEQKSAVEGQTQDHGSGFSMVAGMAELKEQLIHEVMGPVKNPELYREYRVSIPNGILFYGPPGCGKTYIARSLAEELGWFFQHCQPSDIASPYIHDTVVKIRGLFALAVEKAPSILFIDEFEAFVPARSDLGGNQQYKAEEVNEFLANLEGCAGREVLVIAATNEPDKIDAAVRRSGRFDKLIFIPPPDVEARRAMLDFHLRGRPMQSAFDTAGIAGILDGYSASDIKLLVDEAARMALQRRDPISIDTLLAALERVPASISKEDIQRYSSFRSRGTSRRGD